MDYITQTLNRLNDAYLAKTFQWSHTTLNLHKAIWFTILAVMELAFWLSPVAFVIMGIVTAYTTWGLGLPFDTLFGRLMLPLLWLGPIFLMARVMAPVANIYFSYFEVCAYRTRPDKHRQREGNPAPF